MTQPRQLQWWQWGKILGLSLPFLFFFLKIEHSLPWAIAAHCFVDFTAQSNQTAVSKAQGDLWVLSYHAFIAGGFPGFIVAGLPGLVIAATVHFLVDLTDKFGLDNPTGPFLDQMIHVITIFAVWWLL
jgi:hypothetical protein